MSATNERAASSIDAYFAAWNDHDAGALARSFAPGGTYVDPSSGGEVPGAAIGRVAEPLFRAFPDLRFERVGGGAGPAVEWVLRGRNSGEFAPSMAPTGGPLEVRGVDLIEGGPDGVRAVRRYYDRKAFVESFGLMALIQPIAQGPAEFGYSMRVASANPAPPGVIALTWIQGKDEGEKERIRAHARQNVQDFLAEPGFLSIVTGFTGLRGFTVTAWVDEASMSRALAKHHAVAMRELFGERFVAAVWTSVWTPSRLNRIWVRCPACGSLEDVGDDHRSCGRCRAELPPRPHYW